MVRRSPRTRGLNRFASSIFLRKIRKKLCIHFYLQTMKWSYTIFIQKVSFFSGKFLFFCIFSYFISGYPFVTNIWSISEKSQKKVENIFVKKENLKNGSNFKKFLTNPKFFLMSFGQNSFSHFFFQKQFLTINSYFQTLFQFMVTFKPYIFMILLNATILYLLFELLIP